MGASAGRRGLLMLAAVAAGILVAGSSPLLAMWTCDVNFCSALELSIAFLKRFIEVFEVVASVHSG